MKLKLNASQLFYALLLLIITGSSCNKDISFGPANAPNTITISGTFSISGMGNDSLLVVYQCNNGSHQDTIAKQSLPAAILTYLDSNYAGYEFKKAYVIKNKYGAIEGYIVLIKYNDKPVALLFDPSGAFIKVLEQREKDDKNGPGWHDGGLFDDRGGHEKDTVAISSLPADILAYMAAHYPQDTLVKAYKHHDDKYVVLSINNGVFATVFDKNGVFIKRVQIITFTGNITVIAQASGLPAVSQTYLTDHFPAYVFNRGFVLKINNVTIGYVAIINANNTRYAVAFDATGKFLAAVTIW
ncbi:MAG: hypothetical protein JWN76_877 [Chitinophagaceae bacterium]|nr:hypothetical protein [Chitinophagaceae bacterium]